MRRPIIIANWKMNMTLSETKEFISEFNKLSHRGMDAEIVISPPFTALSTAAEALKDTGIKLAGQNLFWEDRGAYTGEVSAVMLKEAGCIYVIIGHSERRQFFGETDETVNKKVKASLRNSLIPIVCMGETLREREEGTTLKVIERQLRGALSGIAKDEAVNIVIAYEPVWAIGTGKTATPGQANEAHQFIRERLSETYSPIIATEIRIIYGGSVTPDNISSLMAENEINGALVGGASLKVESFAKICNNF